MGLVLGCLVILLGIFTFYQEYSSNKVMESFAKMVPSFAVVLREGQLETINCKELVVGDIIEVKYGDQLPADIRIIEANAFKARSVL
jgi:P-type E1-E2 ATPase